ncbi:MAG: HAMP domain-containing histidine kinase [Chloroflexi bacterium]|nr:HAMP domain-containing histidine kinase [Chloroflexota bacterium]
MADRVDRTAWGLFLDDLVHELRTPLTAIGGYAMLLGEEVETLPDAARLPVRTIETQSERMAAQLALLLEIARRWSGKHRLDPRRFDLATLARSFARSGTARVDALSPAWIRADRKLVTRMMGILVDNAERHGSPPVTIRVAPPSMPGFSVCDHGLGIAPSHIEAIGRRPFIDGDDAARRTGTGLSLVLAAAIAETHGGSLRYERDDGETRFVVDLP